MSSTMMDSQGTTEQATPPRIQQRLVAGLRQRLAKGDFGPWPVMLGLALIWLLFQSQNEHFLTARNLSNLILQIGVLGTLAIGVVLVLVLGEIDLSLGAVAGVCAGILGVNLTLHHWGVWQAVLVTLLVGAAIGLLQGAIIVLVGVPSFLVTLAGLLAWGGVQIILLGTQGELLINDQAIRDVGAAYLTPTQSWVLAGIGLLGFGWTLWRLRVRRLQAGLPAPTLTALIVRFVVIAVCVGGLIALLNAYFGVPYILVILIALVLALTWVMQRTLFGRYITAIGGNKEAARRAGINVSLITVSVFVTASALAALGGILAASREFAVSIGTGGGTLLLDAIAAAVIGGTSLFGGRGQVYHALLGALVIGSVENGLDLLGQPSSVKDIATGVILVLAVSIDAISRKRAQSR